MKFKPEDFYGSKGRNPKRDLEYEWAAHVANAKLQEWQDTRQYISNPAVYQISLVHLLNFLGYITPEQAKKLYSGEWTKEFNNEE